MRRGGDHVRFWLAEAGKGAGQAGHVTDLGNGSYIGEVTAMWKGRPQVNNILLRVGPLSRGSKS